MSKVYEAELDRQAQSAASDWNVGTPSTDRPVEALPHTSAPDGPEPDTTLDPFAIPGSVLPVERWSDGKQQPIGELTPDERATLDAYLAEQARDLGLVTDRPAEQPPPVPDGPASLAQQLGDTAIANLHAACRNRIAFMCALTAFTVNVNYLYQALGELEPEDFQHTSGTLGQLTTGVDLLQARLANIEARAPRQMKAAE